MEPIWFLNKALGVMKSELVVMVVCIVTLALLVGAKRRLYQVSKGLSAMRSLLRSTVLFLIPSCVAWTTAVVLGSRLIQANIPAIAVQAVTFLGFIVLVEVLLGKELSALRRA